jgi:glc operon protein GlcG
MIARVGLAVLVAVLSVVPMVGQSVPLLEKKVISVEAARKMVAVAEAEAVKNNLKLSFTVVDDSGNLIYFEHMDGASLSTIDYSQGKARTAARNNSPSGNFEDRLNDGKLIGLAFPGVTALRGGLPIVVDGKVVGAIAASGARTGAQDEACVQAGIDAVMKP